MCANTIFDSLPGYSCNWMQKFLSITPGFIHGERVQRIRIAVIPAEPNSAIQTGSTCRKGDLYLYALMSAKITRRLEFDG